VSLVTRCPRCKTLFRVTPVQLQAHSGDVRCGRCMQVFDGYEAMAVEQPSAPATAVGEDALASAADARAASIPDASIAAGAETELMGAFAIAGAEPAAMASFTSAAGDSPGKSPRLPAQAAMGVAACVFLALLLVAQIAYAMRGELAARSAVMKTLISGACGFAGCSVSLPQRPELVRIEASDVRMIDASRPALIQLTATLRSYATYDLAYPALDLVLTNANEHALARRIFVPEEYLDATRDIQAGMAPHAEITVALDLDTGELNASGFRIDLLRAPSP
jgi:predicted Zn finger-like uncharacterized protein